MMPDTDLRPTARCLRFRSPQRSAVYNAGGFAERAGTTTYDLSDRLGTASRQTDAAKSTTATRSYDAFGMLQSTTGTPKGPFGFAGGTGTRRTGTRGSSSSDTATTTRAPDGS